METQLHDGAAETVRPYCKNCNERLSKRGKFCPSCGQRDFDGRVRMRDLFSKFFSSLTHLDNKFLKMAWRLLMPGLVTVEYFQGKIKRYPHPLQFFFIVMFFFLLLLSKRFDEATLNIFGGNFQIGGESVTTYGHATVSRARLFEALQRCMAAKEFHEAIDSLPPVWKSDSIARLALDSLDQRVNQPWVTATSMMLHSMSEPELSNDLDSVNLFMGLPHVKLSTKDFVTLDADSIIRKYQLETWYDKITVKQGIKAVRDQHGFINRYLGSFAWAILVLIAGLALLLRALYFKKRPYYVEHFIFLLHLQAGSFLLLTIAYLVNDFVFFLDWGWLLVIGWFMLMPFPAMYRFYGDSWGWTLLKGFIFTLFYYLGIVALFIATLLIVFALF